MQTDVCGDLLLLFSAERPSRILRSGTGWTAEERGDSWVLWRSDAGPGWTGFPVRRFSAAGWRLWIVGEVFGSGDESLLEAEVLAAAEGRRSAGNLNGHFLLLAWSEAAREWHVLTNRFGTLHAYVAFDGRRAAIGTFSPAVAEAASRKKLDWAGLTGFFSFGFFPEDRTFFEDVRIVRPATRRVFDSTGRPLREVRTWVWRHEPDRHRRYAETVEQFGEVIRPVLADLAEGVRLAVPISGGLDSRTAAAVLTDGKGARDGAGSLWAYSYGYTGDSIETRIARKVAAARRLPFEALTVPSYLFDQIEDVLRCVEGFQDLTQCRQAIVAARLAAGADRVLAAHWGDVWFDDAGLAGFPAPGTDRLVEHCLKKIRKPGAEWLETNVCAPHVDGGDVERTLDAFVREDLRRLEAIEDPDFRVKAFKTDAWSFRWTLASLRMFQAGAFPRLPFYDTRVADFFLTVPSEFLAGRRLQIDFLKRSAPDLAAITWQAHDANLFWATRPHSLQIPKRAMKKLWRLATRRRVVERNWEVQFLSPSGRSGLEKWLSSPGLKLHDLVPREAVAALLADFLETPGARGRGYTISMLLTFSAWLETYG